ncbi:MAG: chemotaxis protein CheX [Denitrovibrio sp.]|nr:MAG: chemotaxis protein CheX [Denitrovibrio sp.]
MKAEFVNPFIASTINVFETMTGLNPVKGDLYIKSDQNLHYDVSAVIGIVGDVVGYVSVSLPEDLAMKIASIFLMEEKEEVDTDVGDAIGELINMIAGSTKKLFTDKGKKLSISVPNVITGRGHTIQRPTHIICVGVKFTLEDQSFVVEIALKEKK